MDCFHDSISRSSDILPFFTANARKRPCFCGFYCPGGLILLRGQYLNDVTLIEFKKRTRSGSFSVSPQTGRLGVCRQIPSHQITEGCAHSTLRPARLSSTITTLKPQAFRRCFFCTFSRPQRLKPITISGDNCLSQWATLRIGSSHGDMNRCPHSRDPATQHFAPKYTMKTRRPPPLLRGLHTTLVTLPCFTTRRVTKSSLPLRKVWEDNI